MRDGHRPAPVMRRLSLALLWALVALMALAGCNRMFQGRRPRDPDRQFVSPVGVLQIQHPMDVAQIQSVLEGRSRSERTLKARLEMTVATGFGGMRQRIDTQVFFQKPALVRARGSQESGTVFDLLLDGQDLQCVIYPERSYYRGTLAQLRNNPQILGGLEPDRLASQLMMEQTLVERFRSVGTPQVTTIPGKYVLDFRISEAAGERYYLRQADLLTDRMETYYGSEVTGAVRVWGYNYFGSVLLPNEFTVDLGGDRGSAFSARVAEAEAGAQPPPAVRRIDVPDGFERKAISRY